jgi:hypothetical protein
MSCGFMRGRARGATRRRWRKARRRLGDERRPTRRTWRDRPSSVRYFDRRLAVDAERGRAGQTAPRRAARARRGLPVDAREVGLRQDVEAREEASVATGVHRHFRSRWLRQNAMSNAGSPHQRTPRRSAPGRRRRRGCSSG